MWEEERDMWIILHIVMISLQLLQLVCVWLSSYHCCPHWHISNPNLTHPLDIVIILKRLPWDNFLPSLSQIVGTCLPFPLDLPFWRNNSVREPSQEFIKRRKKSTTVQTGREAKIYIVSSEINWGWKFHLNWCKVGTNHKLKWSPVLFSVKFQ